jgi:hypothetical protein
LFFRNYELGENTDVKNSRMLRINITLKSVKETGYLPPIEKIKHL